jgi:hypothetical protein
MSLKDAISAGFQRTIFVARAESRGIRLQSLQRYENAISETQTTPRQARQSQ